MYKYRWNNPFTNHVLNSWDIQVDPVDMYLFKPRRTSNMVLCGILLRPSLLRNTNLLFLMGKT